MKPFYGLMSTEITLRKTGREETERTVKFSGLLDCGKAMIMA